MSKHERDIKTVITWGVCIAHLWWVFVAVDVYLGWLTSDLPIIMGGILAAFNMVLFGFFLRMEYRNITEKKHGRK